MVTPNQHVLILRNPRAGKAQTRGIVDELERRLKTDGFRVETLTDISTLVGRAQQLSANDDLRTVVAAGGDGTVSTLANLLPSQIPISILPMGTENLLAKYLGIRRSAEQVAD